MFQSIKTKTGPKNALGGRGESLHQSSPLKKQLFSAISFDFSLLEGNLSLSLPVHPYTFECWEIQ